MGTGLAETIGAAKSNKFKKLICIIGDGSFLMNIQDLQTIVQDKINVIILLVNNNGYLAIRHTQKEFLNSRYYGTHPEFNLTLPNFQKISNAFGIKYIKINTNKNLKKTLSFLKKNNSPIVCEIITDENQPSLFKQGYKRNAKGLLEPQPLSEMFPYFENQVANTNN
jgi:acetolactate synthase-1/2/3 large subunit